MFKHAVEARPGQARRGLAGRGLAGRGKARHGEARFFITRKEHVMAKGKNARKDEKTAEAGMSGAPATMKPEIVTFLIAGRSPLLQNNPAEFIGAGDDTALTAGKKQYDDEEEARLRTYKDPDGAFCHPCEAFTKAMIKAVSGKKFGKMFATSTIKGSVFIVEPYALIEDAKGKPAKKYNIDRRPVVVGKARVLRCRPCWSPWQIRLPLEIDTAILSPELVEESLSLAGRIIGIGDYRPEKGGGFGRFTAQIA